MSRKYRIWNKTSKVMIYPINHPNIYMRLDGVLVSIDHDGNEEKIHDCIRLDFTGLKDKNGKEAYHKDKVSALGYDWIIEWHRNGWKLKQEDAENYKDIPDSFIIFGNIYMNTRSF